MGTKVLNLINVSKRIVKKCCECSYFLGISDFLLAIWHQRSQFAYFLLSFIQSRNSNKRSFCLYQVSCRLPWHHIPCLIVAPNPTFLCILLCRPFWVYNALQEASANLTEGEDLSSAIAKRLFQKSHQCNVSSTKPHYLIFT